MKVLNHNSTTVAVKTSQKQKQSFKKLQIQLN